MGPVLVVPLGEVAEFSADVIMAVGDQQFPGAFAFDRSHQSFDDGDAAVFPDCSEALLDSLATTPCLEPLICELFALIGDEVLRDGLG